MRTSPSSGEAAGRRKQIEARLSRRVFGDLSGVLSVARSAFGVDDFNVRRGTRFIGEVREGHRPAPVTLLVVNQLLASDPDGHDVPWCPTFRWASFARICAGPAGHCDFNDDGREDIRDLVMMMRCLRDLMLCADPAGRADCNGDQAFTLDDVMCCAEHILRVDCAGCPPGETRDAGGVRISLGPPTGRAPSPVIVSVRSSMRLSSTRSTTNAIESPGAPGWKRVPEATGTSFAVANMRGAPVSIAVVGSPSRQ